MRVNNNETINPSQTRNSIQQIFPARSKRIKKVTLVSSSGGAAGASDKNGEVYWPVNFNEMYEEATTPMERACVGVLRIEHFIKTKFAE